MSENNEKAYVVVRRDMSAGYQIVQSAHAVAEHEKDFPGSMAGRTMVVVSVPDEVVLLAIADVLARLHVSCTVFWEPDIQAHTAMAVSPSEWWGIFAGLPLAGS